MNKALTVKFDQFAVSLTEFVEQDAIDRRFCEALTLYASGHSVEQVAATIQLLEDRAP